MMLGLIIVMKDRCGTDWYYQLRAKNHIVTGFVCLSHFDKQPFLRLQCSLILKPLLYTEGMPFGDEVAAELTVHARELEHATTTHSSISSFFLCFLYFCLLPLAVCCQDFTSFS